MTGWRARRRVVLSLSMVLVATACSTPGATTGPSGSGSPQGLNSAGTTAPPSSGAVPSAVPSPPAGDDVRLHGTFTGHYDDFLTTTDATFDVIVIWKRPNDIHDMLSFTFESGSYTFSTVVDGVCGGTRSEGGPLVLRDPAAPISLGYGDPQERSYEVHISLIDQRLNQEGLWFNPSASFDIPNGAVGCEPPYQSKGFVPVCAMEFKLATLDTLETRASCTQGEATWTGNLVEQ
jgi:hypothetical protein